MAFNKIKFYFTLFVFIQLFQTNKSLPPFQLIKALTYNYSGLKSNHSSAGTLFRDPNQNDTNCDGYILFMEDISLTLAGIDFIILITDIIPLTIDAIIAIWDFFVFYILGPFFNYVDFNSVTGIGPVPSPTLTIIVTLISIMTVVCDVFFFRPLSSLTYLWTYLSLSFANLSLAVAVFSQFEEEILALIGPRIRPALQEYLKDYNYCYTNSFKRMQMSYWTNISLELTTSNYPNHTTLSTVNNTLTNTIPQTYILILDN